MANLAPDQITELYKVLDKSPVRHIDSLSDSPPRVRGAIYELQRTFKISTLGQLVILEREQIEAAVGSVVTRHMDTSIGRVTSPIQLRIEMAPHELHGWFKERRIPAETQLIDSGLDELDRENTGVSELARRRVKIHSLLGKKLGRRLLSY